MVSFPCKKKPCSARRMAQKKQRTDESPLLEWASAHGVKLSGVAVRGSADSGLGLFATERLDAGRQIVLVPDDLILSAQLAADSPIGQEIADAGINIIHDLKAAREGWIRALGGSAGAAAGGQNARGTADNSVTRRSVLYVLLIYLRHVHKPGQGQSSMFDKFVPFACSLADDVPSVYYVHVFVAPASGRA